MHKGNTPRIACDLTADEDAAEGDAEGDQGPAARDKVEGLRERGRARDAVLVVLHGVGVRDGSIIIIIIRMQIAV